MQAILHRQMVRRPLRCLQRRADRGGGLHRRVGAHVSTKRVTYARVKVCFEAGSVEPLTGSAGLAGRNELVRIGLLVAVERTTDTRCDTCDPNSTPMPLPTPPR
jgi:hypothetical protein